MTTLVLSFYCVVGYVGRFTKFRCGLQIYLMRFIIFLSCGLRVTWYLQAPEDSLASSCRDITI